jgi:hypothetical protein
MLQNTMLHYAWIVVLLGVAWLVQKLRVWARPKLNFPVVGEPGRADYSDAILEGYRKVNFMTSPQAVLRVRLTCCV